MRKFPKRKKYRVKPVRVALDIKAFYDAFVVKAIDWSKVQWIPIKY